MNCVIIIEITFGIDMCYRFLMESQLSNTYCHQVQLNTVGIRYKYSEWAPCGCQWWQWVVYTTHTLPQLLVYVIQDYTHASLQ